TQPVVLSMTVNSASHISCKDGSDGEVILNTSGGTLPYSYSWDQGSGSFLPISDHRVTASGLSATNYIARVTDANGCTAVRHFGLTEPDALTVTITNFTEVSTPGASDGDASAEATGGTAPYTYEWSNGATTAEITGIPAGTYTVNVKDANGCEASTVITITDADTPLPPIPPVTATTNPAY